MYSMTGELADGRTFRVPNLPSPNFVNALEVASGIIQKELAKEAGTVIRFSLRYKESKQSAFTVKAATEKKPRKAKKK